MDKYKLRKTYVNKLVFRRKKVNEDMTTMAIERKSLKDFINKNKEKIYNEARNNTQYNSKGQAVISKDDPSFHEDEWDEHFKRMDNK